MRDADLDLPRGRGCLQVPEVEGRRCRPRGIVLVGDGRPEDAVQVRPLVTEGELEEVPAVAGHDPLRGPDEVVQLRDGVGIVVVVDAGEAQEDRERRTELGQQFAPPVAQSLVDRRQQPRPDQGLVERRRLLDRDRRDIDKEGVHDPEGPAGRRLGAPLADPDPVAECSHRRWIEDDLALFGVMLGFRQVVDQRAGQHVDELDVGVPDDEATGGAARDRDLQGELDGRAPGRPDRALALHRGEHRHGGCGRARTVVPIEPARDGVAREVDDITTASVQLLDDGVEDAAQVRRQLLRPALRSELGGQRLRQRREAGDVRKERRADDPIRHVADVGERPPSVAGDVGLRIIASEEGRDLGHGRPIVRGARCGRAWPARPAGQADGVSSGPMTAPLAS